MLMFKLGFHAALVPMLTFSLVSFVAAGCRPTQRTIAVIDQKMEFDGEHSVDSGPGLIAITNTVYKGKGASCKVLQTERFEIVAAKQTSSDLLTITLSNEIPGCAIGKVIEVKETDVVVENIEVTSDKVARSSPSDRPHSFGSTSDFSFPISYIPKDDFTTSGRGYAARRPNGRLHAANDLLGKPGTPVLAVASGTVIDYYEFYCGSYAIVVDHGGFIVRYGEVSAMAAGVSINTRVQKGQVIGKMGALCGGSAMLHFEKYKGTLKGNLTVRENVPFQRRADLENPTSFLNGLKTTVKNNI